MGAAERLCDSTARRVDRLGDAGGWRLAGSCSGAMSLRRRACALCSWVPCNPGPPSSRAPAASCWLPPSCNMPGGLRLLPAVAALAIDAVAPADRPRRQRTVAHGARGGRRGGEARSARRRSSRVGGGSGGARGQLLGLEELGTASGLRESRSSAGARVPPSEHATTRPTMLTSRVRNGSMDGRALGCWRRMWSAPLKGALTVASSPTKRDTNAAVQRRVLRAQRPRSRRRGCRAPDHPSCCDGPEGRSSALLAVGEHGDVHESSSMFSSARIGWPGGEPRAASPPGRRTRPRRRRPPRRAIDRLASTDRRPHRGPTFSRLARRRHGGGGGEADGLARCRRGTPLAEAVAGGDLDELDLCCVVRLLADVHAC